MFQLHPPIVFPHFPITATMACKSPGTTLPFARDRFGPLMEGEEKSAAKKSKKSRQHVVLRVASKYIPSLVLREEHGMRRMEAVRSREASVREGTEPKIGLDSERRRRKLSSPPSPFFHFLASTRRAHLPPDMACTCTFYSLPDALATESSCPDITRFVSLTLRKLQTRGKALP